MSKLLTFIYKSRYKLLNQFLIGGFLLSTYYLIINYGFPNIAGLLSGALPITFSYVLLTVYLNNGRNASMKSTSLSLKGSLLWQLFAIMMYVCLKYNINIYISLAISFVTWIIMTYIFFHNI